MTTFYLSNMISVEKVDKRTKYERFDAFLSDKGRLIYSAPFRRMQQKAQVFSLESNSAVRSRLSHSLEVAHIGAYISHAITKEIKSEENQTNQNKKFWTEHELSINTIVETTCLMHDIGNPPFGHFGESTICEWFKDDERIAHILHKAEIISDRQNLCDCIKQKLFLSDFTMFDGNPQAIRIATKLQGDDGLTGLNFTYTQIASSLKYTFGGCNFKKDKDNHLSSKLGYFSTEEDIIKSTWKNLGIPHNGRHPLTFIMEAADDISYCTSDIDDGIENKVVTGKALFDFINDKTKNSKITDPDAISIIEICAGKQNNKKISQFTEFKTNLSKRLVSKAAKRFYENFENIMNFKFTEPLLNEKEEDGGILHILNLVKEFTREHIFNHADVEMVELSGHSIITGILNSYRPILELSDTEFRKLINRGKSDVSKVAQRLFRTLPEKYVKSFKAQIDKGVDDKYIEWNLRAHLIIDFISGMTDQFALELYQSLAGIKVR
ncbi:dGTPase [Pantoea dispersa]|uniref:dGTPase n=1 Tax=Pantoea dispersa TaxID=59814 RepID=UPI001266D1A3|nr:dGTPase [Pantoea dispersa]QFS61389.1 dGTPase [Pantoea dispersa]